MVVPDGTRDSKLILIFANPIAGKGRGKRTAERLHTALQSAGYDARPVYDRADRAKLPSGQPVHAAISIGGDGTLRTVVSRLSQDLTTQPPPTLVIPTGTANLMKQSLKINWDEANLESRVVQTIRDYHTIPRDAATANGKLFLIIAGAGLDGQIIHELEARRTGPISLLSYTVPTLLSVKNWTYPPITVEVDGKVVFGPAPGMAMVGSVKEHGIGFSFLLDAIPDDGLLNILAFPCKNLFEGLQSLLQAALGQLPKRAGAIYLTGKHCRVLSDPPLPLQADGEAAGFTPLDVSLLPFQVPFLIPAGKTE